MSAASHLSDATSFITSAVSDCGGASNQCETDIELLALSLGNATADVDKAVHDCSPFKFACIGDVVNASKAVAASVQAISSACDARHREYESLLLMISTFSLRAEAVKDC